MATGRYPWLTYKPGKRNTTIKRPMYRKTLIIAMLFMCYSCFLKGQQIQAVRSEVKDEKILVHYVIRDGSLTDYFSISLYVSTDGGKTFTGPLREVKGDAGEGIRRGTKIIVWDALKEMPFLEDTITFQVRALKQPVKKKFFVTWEGNTITWLGLRAGMLGKIGFYVEFRGNPDALKKSSFTCNDGVLTDYNVPGYYSYTGKNGYSAFSVLGGINWQVVPDLYIYGGAGYGKENYLVQVDQFNYDNSAAFGKAYAKYTGYCTSGLEIDAGLMYRVKWFLVSAGATTLNFNLFNWTAGIGVTF
jgi:hypothetical protein